MKPKPVEDKYVVRLFQRDKDFAGLVQLRMDIEAVDQAGNELDEAGESVYPKLRRYVGTPGEYQGSHE